jgi:hypothetical protein
MFDAARHGADERRERRVARRYAVATHLTMPRALRAAAPLAAPWRWRTLRSRRAMSRGERRVRAHIYAYIR